ncbi:MAG: branched-chain amino acid ABC transporter substrate-binding protein [Chloroflexia bacterium]
MNDDARPQLQTAPARATWVAWVAALVAITLLLLVAIPMMLSGRFRSGIVKIAVDLPGGGAETEYSIPARQGIQLAIDQANAAGGVTLDGKHYTIQMYFLDDVPPGGQVHEPVQGSKNADTFIADPDVMAMVGPLNSNVARLMMPKLNTAGLAGISPGTTAADLTLARYNSVLSAYRPTGEVTYFRVCPTDNIEGSAGADYAYDKLGKRKAYILDDTGAYGKIVASEFEQEFKATGGTVLGHDSVPMGTADFSPIMNKVASTGPDILYYGGTESHGISAARKAMKPAGLTIPLMGGDGIFSSNYARAASPDSEGDYSAVAKVNSNVLPEAKAFTAAYMAAFGNDRWGGVPQAYSAYAYDATNIIIAAMKTAGKRNREAIRAAIAATKDFKGALGTTGFDANGDTTNRWISIYKVENGAWIYIDQVRAGAGGTGY